MSANTSTSQQPADGNSQQQQQQQQQPVLVQRSKLGPTSYRYRVYHGNAYYVGHAYHWLESSGGVVLTLLFLGNETRDFLQRDCTVTREQVTIAPPEVPRTNNTGHGPGANFPGGGRRGGHRGRS